jgi:Protein of unknown function (DUF3592)
MPRPVYERSRTDITLRKLTQLGPPVVVAIAGLTFLCLGGGRIYLNQLYSQHGQRALGTVTHYTSRQAGANPVSSSRTDYQFTTPDGRQIRGHQPGYYSHVGEQVLIEYLPTAPQWNRFAGAGRRNEPWNLPMALGGLLFFAAGAYATVRTVRVR